MDVVRKRESTGSREGRRGRKGERTRYETHGFHVRFAPYDRRERSVRHHGKRRQEREHIHMKQKGKEA